MRTLLRESFVEWYDALVALLVHHARFCGPPVELLTDLSGPRPLWKRV